MKSAVHELLAMIDSRAELSAPNYMLREAPLAAGPNLDRGPYADHAGAAQRPAAVKCDTACRGPNRDQWLCVGRGSYASTRAHLSTAGRGTRKGPRAASGPKELRDSERPH
jgi:hypothetical protein